MSKSNYLENQLLLYTFNQVVPDFDADATYYFTLHTDPINDDDTQDVNEVPYGGWSRVAISRTAGEWVVTGVTVANINDIACPKCLSNPCVAKYGSIGRLASGAGKILFSGPLTDEINININGIPVIPAGSASMTKG
jgi:hypothetical protein